MLRKNLGNLGESLAAIYLRFKGYRVIEKNWRCRLGEIDLICRYRRQLVFVEVKTRSTVAYGFPEEAVTTSKLAKLESLAQCYIDLKKISESWRIEVISIVCRPGSKSFGIRHLTDL